MEVFKKNKQVQAFAAEVLTTDNQQAADDMESFPEAFYDEISFFLLDGKQDGIENKLESSFSRVKQLSEETETLTFTA